MYTCIQKYGKQVCVNLQPNEPIDRTKVSRLKNISAYSLEGLREARNSVTSCVLRVTHSLEDRNLYVVIQ